MTPTELNKILELHKKWLNSEDGGKRADLRWADLRWADLQSANLQGANLRWADLRGADLRWADLQRANLQEVNLQEANLQGANLQGANLQGANLQGANLREADLQGADLDFSCWPLWCGSFNVKVDKRIAAQLAYHFCRVNCDDEEVKAAQKALTPLANQFHRVDECGKIEWEDEK